MKEIILLEGQNKPLVMFSGLFWLFGGILNTIKSDNTLMLIAGIGMLLMGIFFTGYALLAFSDFSKYAGKVQMTDQRIELRSNFWKPTLSLPWSEIRVVHFSNQALTFELPNETKVFQYNTTSKQSKRLKQTLKGIAEDKNIETVNY